MLARKWGRKNPHALLVGMYIRAATMEIRNLKTEPAVPLLGVYLKESKSVCNRHTRAPMFITALFTITRLGNQLRCSHTDEWMEKMWFPYTTEYYLATKKNKFVSFAGKFK
jgi:hypothetical protein